MTKVQELELMRQQGTLQDRQLEELRMWAIGEGAIHLLTEGRMPKPETCQDPEELSARFVMEGMRSLLLKGEISINTARSLLGKPSPLEDTSIVDAKGQELLESGEYREIEVRFPVRALAHQPLCPVAYVNAPLNRCTCGGSGYRNVGRSIWLEESTGKFFFTMHGDASSPFAGPYDTIEEARKELEGERSVDVLESRDFSRSEICSVFSVPSP